jgi:hypothetical protein
MKTYIIHMSEAVEREDLVTEIVKLTNASVFKGVVVGSGRDKRDEGCFQSHLNIYKSIPPDEDLMIFEDDCEIVDPQFLSFVDENKHNYDLMYIGVNYILQDKASNIIGSFGTHAMWISSKALSIFLAHPREYIPIDHFWCKIEQEYKLAVWRPEEIYKYVRQKNGLKSYITGNIRQNKDQSEYKLTWSKGF